MKRFLFCLTAILLVSGLAYAADTAINARTELAEAPAENDVFPFYDTSGTAGKRVSAINVMNMLEAALTDFAIHVDNLPTSGSWDMSSMTVNFGLEASDIPDLSATYQPADADLDTYSGITPSADVQTMLGSADNAAILSNIGAEAEAHAADHAVSGADTIFPTDPGADRYLMWDDDPGELVWGSPAGSGDVESVGDCLTGACLDGTDDGGTYIRLYDGNSNYTQFSPGDSSGNLTWTFPTAYPAGNNYLLQVSTAGAISTTNSLTTLTFGGFTADRAIESDGSGNLESSATTAAELAYLDIAALGTGAASKAVVLDGSGNYTAPAGTWDLSGVTAITLRAGEIVTADIGNDQIDSQHYAAGSIDNEHLADDAVGVDELATDSVTMDAIDADGNFASLTGDWTTTGYVSSQANVQTDTSGGITITVNAVNYGTDTGDADIPDGACDAAGDVGNWVVLISSAADAYSLTSNDASNQFIITDNASALTAGNELDVDGTMVAVMCIAAELWKVTGYMGAIPTDGGTAD